MRPQSAAPRTQPGSPRVPDMLLLAITLVLVGLGILMVFSSSSYTAEVRMGDSLYYLKRQGVWAMVGLFTLLVLQRLDYRIYRRYARGCIFLALILLVFTLVPGIGVAARGSQRAIMMGPIFVSPAELIKLCLVIYLSHTFCRVPEKIKRFWIGVVPPLIVVGVVVGLILLQPDLGTASTIAGTALILLYIAGARFFHLLLVVLAGAPVAAHLIMSEEYRRARFLAFLDPWADPMGSGFHIIQSLYALGSGRILGMGLGAGHQKFLYLPEQHTDFIFSVLGEEMGLVGCLFVLLLFAALAWRGFRIAACAPDSFASLLAAGITVMILFQVVINIGVVTSVLPVTGIPLPFISYGGSSLVVAMASIGILMNISRHCRM